MPERRRTPPLAALRRPAAFREQRSGKKRQRVFDMGDRVAGQSERVKDHGDRKAQANGLAANDQAKPDRVVVDRAGPAAAAGRPRTDVLPDAPDRRQGPNLEY